MRVSLLKWLGAALLAIGAGATLAHFAGVFTPAAPTNAVPQGSFISATADGTEVFINEFHYDNAGTDAGEFIEIAGPAGTDLSGWSIVLYNGNGGAVYDTEALSGTLTDDTGTGIGFTVVNYPTNGIQNGGPDGIALVDNTGSLVQFLGYEGTFTGVGGAADGIEAVDIGVSESGSTPEGFSLQLGGTGCTYEDFTWNAPDAETPGAVNNSQTFECAAAEPVVFINEFHYDNAGTDTGEFIEISGTAGTDLSGWSIVLYNGNGGGTYNTTTLSGTLTDDTGTGFGFFAANTPNLQNGSPDGFALVDPDGNVVQFLSYEGSFTATNGPAAGMTSVDVGVSEPSNTPVGESLQLAGTGCTYEEFTWQPPAADTPGAVNNNQTFECGVVATTLALSIDPTSISENGGTATGTVTRTGDTSAALTVNLSSNDTSEATVPASVEILANETEATFTVTGVDESDVDGTQTVTITASAPDIADATANIDVEDDDVEIVGQPWINEFHYDNDGGDIDEFIEVAGSTGTNLTGWTIVLYNGSSGQTYGSTINLSGTLSDDTGTGYGFQVVYPASIQNGAPDGFALVDANGAVVQFLSYEGTFVAASGPAAGMTSVDVGVSEPGSTPVGESLQLAGTGCTYEEFTWQPPADDTPGAVNNNQIIDCNPTPSIALSIDPTSISENGGTATGTVTRTGDTSAALTVNLSSNDTSEATVPASVEILANETEVTFTVTGVDESDVDGTQTVTITAAATGFDDATATVAVEDDDAAIVYTKIHEVQGSGTTSPLVGQTVTIQGIVVGDYDESGEMNGFFVQEETSDEDGNAATSEGIFVYCAGACSPAVSIGNLVTVEGTVTEYNGLTELTYVTITVNDSINLFSLVTPVIISFPQSSESDLEAYENMFVQISTGMRVTEYFNFDRYSEIRVWNDGSGAERPMQYTQVNTPDATGYAQAEADFAAASVLLDDGSNSQNVGKLFPQTGGVPIFGDADFTPGTPDGGFRGGDIINNIEGVMGYAFDEYRIYISDPSAGTATDGNAIGLTVVSENPRPVVPSVGNGSLTVASFNVLNFFTTLDTGPDICGPSANQECRGADNSTEYDRQLTKIVNALAELDADIVGLIELENNVAAAPAGDGIDPVLEALVTALNAQTGRTYSFVDAGVIGTDAIKVAFIYDVNTVNLVGTPAILDSSVDPRFIDTKNRPALAQTFEEAATGGVFTVVVNHLKSKGSACDDVGDPNQDDGAGNCNATRTAAAEAMVDWLATDPTASGDEDFLIIGDLNSYAMEDPIMAIRAGADDTASTSDDYTNLVTAFGGANAYGYVFDGRWGTLDYALANQSLAAQVTGVAEWHVNADEPDALDYDFSFNPQAWFDGTDAFRASDHDPVVIGLNLETPVEPVTINVTQSSDTINEGDPVTYSIESDIPSGETVTLEIALQGSGINPIDGDDLVGNAVFPGTIQLPYTTGDSLQFTVTPDDDSDVEPDEEMTFSISIVSGDDHISVGTDSATTTILNNDQALGRFIVGLYEDRDGDGRKDHGDDPDPGLEDWIVTLYDLDGNELSSRESGQNGYVNFFDVVPGEYTICVMPLEGWINLTPGDNCQNEVAVGGENTSLNFGYYRYGHITVEIYEDLNGDGRRNFGDDPEPVLLNQTATLYDADGNEVSNVGAGPNGYINFWELFPGEYTVCVPTPANYTNTDPGTDPACKPVTVPSGADELVKFGHQPIIGTITIVKDAQPDATWLDWEFTISQDGNTVESFWLDNDASNDDQLDRETFSLYAGTYSISELNAPGNWDTDIYCGDEMLVADANGAERSVEVTIAGGEDLTCTFVNKRRGQVQITKLLDADGTLDTNTDQAPGAGWQMFLYQEVDGDYVQIQPREVLTNVDGIANYTSLIPDTYAVCEDVQDGYRNLGALVEGQPAATFALDGRTCVEFVSNYTEVDHVTFINVAEVSENLPPTVDPIADQYDIVGESASIQVIANDPEALALRYDASGLPTGISIDPATGLISGTFTEAGIFNVTITVTDSEGQIASTAFTWTVEEPTPTEPTPTEPTPTEPTPTEPTPTEPTPTEPTPTEPTPTEPTPTEPTPTEPTPTEPTPTEPTPTEPTPTEPVPDVQALEVCWIENPNGNTSAWQVTNPNTVPLFPGQQDKVVFSWQVFDADGEVLQSAERWDQTGETRINTELASHIEVTWYVFDNELSAPIGMAVAFATEDYHCETDAVIVPEPTEPAPTEPTPTEPTPTEPAPTPVPDVEIEPLDVCWIENPNGNTSAWQVTNPNAAPLIQGQPDKVLFAWQVFDAEGTVLQSAERWDQTGETRINTVLASYIQVTWFYFDNNLSEPLGITMAFAVEEDRCGQ